MQAVGVEVEDFRGLLSLKGKGKVKNDEDDEQLLRDCVLQCFERR